MTYAQLFQPKPSYTYSDIGIIPRERSTIESRKTDVDTSFDFLGIHLDLPIVVAPMRSVVGAEMAIKIRQLGGVAILPRIDDVDECLENAYDVAIETGHDDVIISIPVVDYENIIGTSHKNQNIICIDVANGFHTNVARAVKAIKEEFPEIKIITGNVASVEGYKFLARIGVDAVRVGIGGGSVCTTSVATGIGVGQASIVRDIARWRQEIGPQLNSPKAFPLIIADGGIKAPGDVVKALALGADVVMVGGAFAGAAESPGKVLKLGDRKYKHLAGQASMFIKGQNEYVEGADKLVPYTKSIGKTWMAFKEGIESGMAYLDCKTLEELCYLDDEYFTYLSDAAKAERQVHA